MQRHLARTVLEAPLLLHELAASGYVGLKLNILPEEVQHPMTPAKFTGRFCETLFIICIAIHVVHCGLKPAKSIMPELRLQLDQHHPSSSQSPELISRHCQ